ncbi:MAG: SDR family oxidoreductase [Deltaproteobacteria bacterium]|nr:SDR family oxidoreductase [Deltaproteobacteria bacterium]
MQQKKCVVITGGAGGIGLALGRCYVADGCDVALLDIDAGSVSAAAEQLGGKTLGLACDVTDAKQCEQAIAQVVQQFGGIDVLVNNAGISHRSRFIDTDLDVFRRVMEINFFGALYCTKFAMSALIARRGQVVTISSVAGFAPLYARTGYAASKYALHGLFDTLRAELDEHGVAITIVCPSFVATAIEQRALDKDGKPLGARRVGIGKLMSPEAVAAKIHSAAQARKQLLLPSPVGKVAWVVSRFAPRFYARQMTKRFSAETAS